MNISYGIVCALFSHTAGLLLTGPSTSKINIRSQPLHVGHDISHRKHSSIVTCNNLLLEGRGRRLIGRQIAWSSVDMLVDVNKLPEINYSADSTAEFISPCVLLDVLVPTRTQKPLSACASCNAVQHPSRDCTFPCTHPS